MTLYDLIRAIERIAAEQPSVNMIVENDMFKLENEPSAKYGVFGFRQVEHTASIDSAMVQYGFEFYYADRLADDRSNQVEVQSVGMQTLDNIVRRLAEEEDVVIEECRYTPFRQKFVDVCSGQICALTIGAVRDGMCAVESDKRDVKVI